MTKQLASVLAQFSLVACATVVLGLAAGACMPTADGGDGPGGDGVSVDAAGGGGDSGSAAVGVNGCSDAEFMDLTAVDATRTIVAGGDYSPKCITVKVGQSVEIQASATHPMRKGTIGTTDPESSGSPIPSGVSNNVTASYVFDSAGTFGFYCEEHGTADMRGAVKVIPWPVDRNLFREEHDLFRQAFRQFVERDVKPHQEKWAAAGMVDREAWRKAGAAGFLCTWLDEKYGGPGGDFLHATVIMEELARAYESGFAMPLHSDVIVPYLYKFGTEEQKQRWLPGCASGELVTAIAMTEPGTGSDLAALATTAVKDGDHYVINGSKTFISNGILCDLCIVAAKTDPNPENAHRGISLFVVEANRPGFKKGKKLAKMGMATQDTSELFFEDCRVPAANLLGPEGSGFMALMQSLQQERLVVAIAAQASAEQVLAETVAYTKERKAFGKPISKLQNTQFKLAECATQVEVGRAFIDRLVAEHTAGKVLVKECSMAKLWQTEMLGQLVDTCLQFFGGYGYMTEYPVTRAYMDARVQRIYAGTSEIMKVIIAKQMGL